ncbi:MAG: hypothetical protein WC238_04570 [Parcubacteria group bacterium]|jgi:hypothetical protein
MGADQIVDDLPQLQGNPTRIPARPDDETITEMVFEIKNKLSGAYHQRRKLFVGRMDTNEEIQQYVDQEFSDFVTEVTLLTIQFYTLETTSLDNKKIR